MDQLILKPNLNFTVLAWHFLISCNHLLPTPHDSVVVTVPVSADLSILASMIKILEKLEETTWHKEHVS